MICHFFIGKHRYNGNRSLKGNKHGTGESRHFQQIKVEYCIQIEIDVVSRPGPSCRLRASFRAAYARHALLQPSYAICTPYPHYLVVLGSYTAAPAICATYASFTVVRGKYVRHNRVMLATQCLGSPCDEKTSTSCIDEESGIETRKTAALRALLHALDKN